MCRVEVTQTQNRYTVPTGHRGAAREGNSALAPRRVMDRAVCFHWLTWPRVCMCLFVCKDVSVCVVCVCVYLRVQLTAQGFRLMTPPGKLTLDFPSWQMAGPSSLHTGLNNFMCECVYVYVCVSVGMAMLSLVEWH